MSSLKQARLRQAVRKQAEIAGLLPIVQKVRARVRQDVGRWVNAGCPSPAPEIVKKSIVRHYLESSGAGVFIETGTFLGTMIEYIARTGVECHTIEIDAALHERARKLLDHRRNVNLILGDSGTEMPKLLKKVDRPALFWLDGHYSGGFTGRGTLDTPISAELEAILAHPVKRHVILIDDARCFNGNAGYPKLSALLAQFDEHPLYRAWVSADIIRIEPR